MHEELVLNHKLPYQEYSNDMDIFHLQNMVAVQHKLILQVLHSEKHI